VFGLAALVAVAHTLAACSRGYWFDEVYMLAIGRNHLDWGSVDQPPVAPALAWLADQLAPGSIIALRVPAILATAAAVVVAALIARELGADRRAQLITAGAQATTLWITLAGHWLTPYALEPLEWLVLGWLLVRWLRRRDDRLLIALGAVVGVAAETKFQVLLLCAVLVVCLLLLGPADLLTRPAAWLGAAIALALAAPTLLWQATHGWPQLRMAGVVAAEAQALGGGRPGIALALATLGGVAGTGLAAYGLVRLARDPALREHRFLGATAVVLYVFFVVVAGRPYYLGGLYALLAGYGAVGLQRRREAGTCRRGWLVWPVFALGTAAAVGALIGSFLLGESDVGESIAERTAAVWHGLPPEQRDHAVIMGESYIVAAFLDGYSDRDGLPPAYSGNRGYGWFRPPPENRDAVLYVGATPDELRAHFRRVRWLADGDGDTSIWLCTGRDESWAALWPRLRHLGVG
jgi:4-amino-4-deoxy-L-arabinose transferase-like glycosyltransferase